MRDHHDSDDIRQQSIIDELGIKAEGRDFDIRSNEVLLRHMNMTGGWERQAGANEMYKTILVPIDVTHLDAGKAMIPVAAQHAEAYTRVILLNVVEEIPEWASHDLPPGLLEKSRQNSTTILNSIVASSDLKMETLVRTGHAYQTILDVADEEAADLIIVASHRPGWQDYFLGSTAAKVVRHAKCSVLVVR